jgi:hypothetical protein
VPDSTQIAAAVIIRVEAVGLQSRDLKGQLNKCTREIPDNGVSTKGTKKGNKEISKVIVFLLLSP